MSGTEAIPSSRPRMLLVQEQNLPDPPPAPAGIASQAAPMPPTSRNPSNQAAFQQEVMSRRAWRASVIGSLNVAAMILAARFILLLATCGAFVLAWMATREAQPLQLVAVGIYLLGVVFPLTWLSSRQN